MDKELDVPFGCTRCSQYFRTALTLYSAPPCPKCGDSEYVDMDKYIETPSTPPLSDML